MEDMKHVLRHLPVNVSEKEVDDMIKEVDKDGNGEIDLDSFRRMIGL